MLVLCWTRFHWPWSNFKWFVAWLFFETKRPTYLLLSTLFDLTKRPKMFVHLTSCSPSGSSLRPAWRCEGLRTSVITESPAGMDQKIHEEVHIFCWYRIYKLVTGIMLFFHTNVDSFKWVTKPLGKKRSWFVFLRHNTLEGNLGVRSLTLEVG